MSKDLKALVVVGRQIDGKGPIEVLQRGGSLPNETWDVKLVQPRMLTVGGAKQFIKTCLENDVWVRSMMPEKIPNYVYKVCSISFQLAGSWINHEKVKWPGSKK